MRFWARPIVLGIAISMFVGLADRADAQAAWSLKDSSDFAPPKSKPLSQSLSTPPGSTTKQKPTGNQFSTPPATNATRTPSRRANRSITPPALTTPTSTSPGSTSAKSSSRGSYHDVATCTVEFIDDVELPAQESGVLRSMLVKEGQAFQKGQGIAQIDDQLYRQLRRQAQMQVAMAQKRATDRTSIRAAKYKVKLATVEAEKARNLFAKAAKSESEYRRARYSQRVAQEELIAAENELQMAASEAQLEQAKLEEVETRIGRHAIRTNFNGYVIEKFRDAGEWVQAGEKVLRVARMDRLYVQGVISGVEYNPFEIANKPVTVTMKLARGETTTFEGTIASVGLEKQGTGDLFMVKAEVNNRSKDGAWILLPGGNVKMRIHLDGKPSVSLGAATPPAANNQR
jgi:multidrug efflux pump subunit AcrA (membrane-fusion protein)